MTAYLTKRTAVFFALLLALFWVTSMWGIWTKNVYALGWNLTLFTAGIIALYLKSQDRRITKRELVWFIPLALIALSYSLYENPFVKAVNMLVLPILFAAYWIITSTRNHHAVVWNLHWVIRLIERLFGFLRDIERALAMILHALIPGGEKRSDLTKRIALGLGIFAVLAFVFFIPILTSADSAFADLIQGFYDYVIDLIALETIMKIVVFSVLTLLMLSGLLHWTKEEEFSSNAKIKHMDSVVSGIVLGGILLLYILFLFTQLSTLWVYELPMEFSSTEHLVKSGFWQLFFLSGINVLLFLLYYRRTSKHVQNILIAFMFASLLLLLSAAKRMGMYVFYYGFSYEKFFATYTVIFAVFLFIRLIAALFQSRKTDILRYLVIAFVWMYAVATVLPVEQMIFRANRSLAIRPDSRINMYELQMLSGDVYGLVQEEISNGDQSDEDRQVWVDWSEEKAQIAKNKRFYEMTLTDLVLR